MRADYAEFLAAKAPRVEATGMKPGAMILNSEASL